jgi:hypothetical protein
MARGRTQTCSLPLSVEDLADTPPPPTGASATTVNSIHRFHCFSFFLLGSSFCWFSTYPIRFLCFQGTTNLTVQCVISGFRCDVNDNSSLVGCYAALSGSSVLTFQDNLSVLPLRVKLILYRLFGTTYGSHLQRSRRTWPLKMGPIGCPQTLVQNYHSTLHNIAQERRCH